MGLQVKKHVKPPPGADKSQGGIVTVEAPLHISKLALLDPVTGYAGLSPCRCVAGHCVRAHLCQLATVLLPPTEVARRQRLARLRSCPAGLQSLTPPLPCPPVLCPPLLLQPPSPACPVRGRDRVCPRCWGVTGVPWVRCGAQAAVPGGVQVYGGGREGARLQGRLGLGPDHSPPRAP